MTMRKMIRIRPFLIFALLCLLAAALPASQAADPQAKPDASATPSGDKDGCLQCHGPFDNLAAGPKKFTAESGDKINPHQYVPHNRKTEKGIPVCTKCHKPHPLPLTSKKDVPEPGIEWCYTCHHTEEFKACVSCHK
jgi:predicted CXXCH cytochrome family protein